MENLIKAAQELIDYIEDNDVRDASADDGGGGIDMWVSGKFRSTVCNLEDAIKDAIPTRDAMKLIKKCFFESVQTAIARQPKQP